jgi:hypothetical protein
MNSSHLLITQARGFTPPRSDKRARSTRSAYHRLQHMRGAAWEASRRGASRTRASRRQSSSSTLAARSRRGLTVPCSPFPWGQPRRASPRRCPQCRDEALPSSCPLRLLPTFVGASDTLIRGARFRCGCPSIFCIDAKERRRRPAPPWLNC